MFLGCPLHIGRSPAPQPTLLAVRLPHRLLSPRLTSDRHVPPARHGPSVLDGPPHPPPPYHEYTAGFSAAPLTPPWFGTKKLAISPVNTLGLDHWLDDSLPRVGQLTADTHA